MWTRNTAFPSADRSSPRRKTALTISCVDASWTPDDGSGGGSFQTLQEEMGKQRVFPAHVPPTWCHGCGSVCGNGEGVCDLTFQGVSISLELRGQMLFLEPSGRAEPRGTPERSLLKARGGGKKMAAEQWHLWRNAAGRSARRAAGTEYKVRVCASWQVQTEEMCWRWWTDGRREGRTDGRGGGGSCVGGPAAPGRVTGVSKQMETTKLRARNPALEA